jgi:hypothetical protein
MRTRGRSSGPEVDMRATLAMLPVHFSPDG